ncbi:MAG: hypothetical protein NTV98_02525, partial [Candidatus Roizmanbacteria bacterium]|nr:hypothetical protein [Candidatus Roizmanbacteria bacterium]
MKKLYLPIVLLILVALGYFSWTYLQTTPQYSFFKMYQAVAARDYPTFIKYVDVDSIVNTLVDKAIEDNNQKTSGGGLLQLGKNLIFKLADNMRPTLYAATQVAVKKGVESGNIAFIYQPQNVIMTIITSRVEQDGDDAILYVEGNNNNVVSIRMRFMGSYWQVYQITL